ncbi:MAG: OmpA family protein [Sandaracinaceae bacterium]
MTKKTLFTALTALALCACDEPEPLVLGSSGESLAEIEEAAPAEVSRLPYQQPPEEELAEPDVVRPAMSIEGRGMEVTCRRATVFFPTDEATLDEDDRSALDALARCLRGTPDSEHVTIVGGADPRASEAYNEQLARQRAEAVASHLRESGVREGSFEIRPVGEDGAIEGMPVLWPLQRHGVARVEDPAR